MSNDLIDETRSIFYLRLAALLASLGLCLMSGWMQTHLPVNIACVGAWAAGWLLCWAFYGVLR